MREFYNAYHRTLDSYSSLRSRLDPEALKNLGLERQSLDALINAKVIAYAAKRLGLEVSPEEVSRAIEANPNLQDQGKLIGVDRYKDLLTANNVGVAEFEEGLRNTLLAAKLRNVVADSHEITDREAREEFKRANEETQVSFFLLKRDDFKKGVAPTEADLRAYFEPNKEKYNVKEQRRAQYLLLSISSVAASLPVSEKEVQD